MKLSLKKLIVLNSVVLSIFFLCACNLESQDQSETKSASIYQKVSPAVFQNKMKEEAAEFKLVDVRTAYEFNSGTIAKSENHDILNGDFEKALKNWDPEIPVYVYCQKGGRSSRASEMMRKEGFKKIIELKGGYSAWRVRTNQ